MILNSTGILRLLPALSYDDVHIYEHHRMTRREVDEFVRDSRRKGELMNRKVFISEKPDEEFEDSKW